LKAHDVTAAAVDWSDTRAARFRECMEDDFNTSEAVAVLFDLANEVNRSGDHAAAVLLKSLGAVIGLLQRRTDEFLKSAPVSDDWTPDRVQAEIDARAAAKKSKNYAEADRIRKALLDAGIVLEDTAKGTSWRRA
jgi:cysteinyl-tRNA synthetase